MLDRATALNRALALADKADDLSRAATRFSDLWVRVANLYVKAAKHITEGNGMGGPKANTHDRRAYAALKEARRLSPWPIERKA